MKNGKTLRRKCGWFRYLASAGRRRRIIAFAAALPICQATGCFPDLIGGLNFELQSLVNSILINTVTIIVQNLLGL
ncbi:MAG: hypothetical protein KF841_06890 [Phycisphaerae bacterium]|nr:hypothetical protein [Phycisphaerae bacterium]